MDDLSLSPTLSQDEQELSAWMRLAQQGDAQAYSRLLARVNAMLVTFVRNTLQRRASWAAQSADDIVQEVLLGLHAKRHTYDPGQRFLPWFYAIARYKIIDALRAQSRRRADVELDEELVAGLGADDGPASLAGVDARALIDGLPEKQREVLTLVKLEGLSVREAAARTGYSASDIKVTVHRAIKSLQKRLRSTSDGNP
jgi:RNA polymerase sigma-70 factor (ECF subfamily)